MTGPQRQRENEIRSVKISKSDGRSLVPSRSGHRTGLCASVHTPMRVLRNPMEPQKAQRRRAPRFALVNEPITTNRNKSD